MRLHRLRVRAFGPFAGTEEVDFDALTAAGLFLLHGPTGAGKTSVLDAVCFALYGSVPGGRTANRLRSDHADPDTPTEVELELTLAGQRLRLTRSPEYHRPKKRGSGTTLQRAASLLAKWDTGQEIWLPVSTSHQEVGEEVQRLLGMSRDQFCQVVLLPQGAFARFLHSSATEREKLLGRLFGTGRFGRAEEWLDERRKAADAACAAVRGGMDRAVQRLREAAGDDSREADGLPSDPLELLGWAAGLRADARERLAVAQSAQELTADRRDAARAAVAAAESLAERQERYRQALVRERELAAGEEQHRAAEARLARANRAEPVAPLLRLRAEAERARAEAVERERAARAGLGQLGGLDGARLRAEEQRIREQLGELRSVRADEERLSGLGSERAKLGGEQSEAEALREDAEQWLAGWPEERRRWESAEAEARSAGLRAEQLADRLGSARQRAEAAGERDRLAARLDTAEQRLRELRDAELSARERWLELRERRLAGMAAELAEQLRAGEPCAVCGSPEHPAPARSGPDRVTRADEQSAQGAQREAEGLVAEAESAARGLRESLAAAEARAGGGSSEELAREVAELTERHAAESRAAAAAVPAAEALRRLEREQAEFTTAREEAARRIASCEARLESLAEEERALGERVAEARGEAPSVAARAEQLTALADGLSRAAEAVRTAAQSLAAAERARLEAEEQARAEGFADAAEAGHALLERNEREGLTARLERRRAQQSAVAGLLADESLVAAAAAAPAEPRSERARAESAERAAQEAFAAVESARARCRALDRLGSELFERAEELAPLAADAEVVRGLAELARGTAAENRLKMPLETYVLAARLEQVASAASVRLERMSGGRYALAHSDERAKGGGRSGLGLVVRDSWTGQDRDTSSLSGGESFFASLALALGLADVVTDEAGGRPLDTLFIDEGFGSLDEETLEDVLDVLDSLRERDRAVGVVSHVAALRGRVRARLRVTKTRSGSTLTLRTGGA